MYFLFKNTSRHFFWDFVLEKEAGNLIKILPAMYKYKITQICHDVLDPSFQIIDFGYKARGYWVGTCNQGFIFQHLKDKLSEIKIQN